MNGRIYDPLLGRFLSADTIIQFPGNLQSYNRYAYVHNNPLTFKDESGHFLNFVIGAVVGAAIDAGSQMVANLATGKSVTDINWKSVAVSGAMGATGVGLGQVAAKAGATMALRIGANAVVGAAEGVIETVATNVAEGKPLTEGMVMNVVTGAAAGVGGDLAGEAVERVAKRMSGAVEDGAQAAAKHADDAGGAGTHQTRLEPETPTTPTPTQTGELDPTPGGGGCFAAGTLVATPEGLVPIESIKVGDTVLAYDLETGEVTERKVLKTPRHFTFYWVDVKVGGQSITATRFHQFWVESESDWLDASELRKGMIVRLADGTTGAIDSVEVRALIGPENTFNLVVDVDHNYFVSGIGVLVHNGTPLDEEGHWNYHLEDKDGNRYYHGGAGPNQNQTDVEYRHSQTGDRFNPANGDRLVVDAEDVTYGERRVNEHIAIEQDGTNIGRGADTDRGNKQGGISERNGDKYHQYMESRAKGGGC